MHFIWYLILWPLKKLEGPTGAPKISLDQKYLTTANPYYPSYNTSNLNGNLISLTTPSRILVRLISYWSWYPDLFHIIIMKQIRCIPTMKSYTLCSCMVICYYVCIALLQLAEIGCSAFISARSGSQRKVSMKFNISKKINCDKNSLRLNARHKIVC